MVREKCLGRCEQASLLGRRDGRFRLYQPTTPDLDLNKDKIVIPPHDEVDFSTRASPLGREARVASSFELASGVKFSCVTQKLAGRARHTDDPHEATGEKQRR